MRLEITLKNGATLVADVSDWKYKADRYGVKLEWTTPADAIRRLKHLDAADIAAIVEVDE